MLRCFALTLRIRSVVDGRLCNYSEVNAWFSLHAGTWERPLLGTLVVVVVLLLYIICCSIVVVAAAACIVLTFGANWLHDSSPCCAESEEGGSVRGRGWGCAVLCVLRQASLGTFRLRNVIALSWLKRIFMKICFIFYRSVNLILLRALSTMAMYMCVCKCMCVCLIALCSWGCAAAAAIWPAVSCAFMQIYCPF